MGRTIAASAAPLPQTAPAVVIGGGIAGAVDAFHLSRAGIPPLVLERASQLAALTTSQAVACFRKQWDEPDYANLVIPSSTFYERFAEETGLSGADAEIGLRQQGWLFASCAADAAARMAAFVAATRSFGVDDSEALDGDEIRRRFPWISPSVVAGAYRARDGWVSPYEVVRGLVRAADGADVRTHCPVSAILVSADGSRVVGVRTAHGDVATDTVVLAAGPFARSLASSVGVALPVEMIRHHRAMVTPQPEIPAHGPMTLDTGTGAYWRPEGGGAFLGMGQADELPGEPVDPVPADWMFPALVMDAASAVTPFWSAVAERATAADVGVAAGQYTVTADGRPILGRSGIDGLWLHTGDNGWGIEGGPEAGRHLVSLITGAVPDDAANNPYRLDRPGVAPGAARGTTY